eukprot:2059909-Ditylum_brightwellii.AAC.1
MTQKAQQRMLSLQVIMTLPQRAHMAEEEDKLLARMPMLLRRAHTAGEEATLGRGYAASNDAAAVQKATSPSGRGN